MFSLIFSDHGSFCEGIGKNCDLSDIGDLDKSFVDTNKKKHVSFPIVYILLKRVIILSIATTWTLRVEE
jgi:hypothetical protein